MQVTVDVKVVSKMSPTLVSVEQPTQICHVCKGNTRAYHSCDYPLVGLKVYGLALIGEHKGQFKAWRMESPQCSLKTNWIESGFNP